METILPTAFTLTMITPSSLNDALPLNKIVSLFFTHFVDVHIMELLKLECRLKPFVMLENAQVDTEHYLECLLLASKYNN